MQTISSTAFNTLITDIGTEITNSVDRGGRSAMTAALPMGGQKITGMADPTASTDGATKNYVDTTTAAFFSTGDVKLTLKTVPDAGWLMFDDGTFGNTSSGSSNSNNVANLALFTLIFNTIGDGFAPIFTSGGGATTRAAQTNAAAAWAANCRMSLPKTLGRALAVAGAGSGLTSRQVGQTTGVESSSLVTANLPPIAVTGTFSGTTDAARRVVNAVTGAVTLVGVTNAGGPAGATSDAGNTTLSTVAVSGSITGSVTGAVGNQFDNMQPSAFLNAMVKV